MKTFTAALWALTLAVAVPSAFAQAPTRRDDARWARSAGAATLTLDGALSEPEWAKAESVIVRYGQNTAGLPGSGWLSEGGRAVPTDPINTTIKFLSKGNDLWIGFVVRDSSVGGSKNFNEKDGFLMDFREKASANRPIPPTEYFYSWWYANGQPADSVGIAPGFVGRFGNFDNPAVRTAAQIAAWDARTVVRGTSNRDTDGPDRGYITEMRVDLSAIGYTPNDADGDIAEFNVSVYDADFDWPRNVAKYSSKRAWWQDPWGNTSVHNHARLHIRSDVTVNSTLPALGADLRIPNGSAFAAPRIDGRLNETVWARADSFRILFKTPDNAATADAVRNGYPGIGPFDSGQFQPELDMKRATVLDPADATVKYFFSADTLYIGARVRDQNVTNSSVFDLFDGFRVIMTDRDSLGGDNVPVAHDLIVRVGPDGNALLEGSAVRLAPDTLRAAITLRSATLNNASDVDAGFDVEMALKLPGFGYPAGRGDALAFLGMSVLDGDVFTDAANSYGNRVWWFRERPGTASSAMAYLDASRRVGTANEPGAELPAGFRTLDAYPNPFRGATTVRYALGAASNVSLRVYDALGRQVSERTLGAQAAGEQKATVDAAGFASGIYYYVVEARTGGRTVTLPAGRLVVVK